MENIHFNKEDFEVFSIKGLEERMVGIREHIQPKFRHFAGEATALLKEELGGVSLPVHVAKHLRRTKYAPDNTWCAIGGDTRGYKKYPHFQIAISGDGVAFYLCLIDQPLKEKEMAKRLLANIPLLGTLPDDFVVSVDHTVADVMRIAETDWPLALARLRDVKKAELMIGTKIQHDDLRLNSEKGTETLMKDTFMQLLPIYKLCIAEYE
ncbi:Hypothetical protein Tpal_1810 [Trichococcus palustris]|uniref:Uncharacterized protein n=1 Tax=Trichococcus palustris TaxID=140314 RepID=A0A143YQE7_9LACT|nr:DUF1054 family protein [Trichococcus palustris]CZQ94887.1 Hypothetical protein Tpal_1810 [Trichococcus palustris]SFK92220.1 Uncharacterized protein YktB, UPF0637 family [Trichococcus palustris]